MISAKVLLDTDAVSMLLRNNPNLMARARSYKRSHGSLSISIITEYEVLRGLKAKDATTQLQRFMAFCGANRVLPLTDEIVNRAADVYADLKRRGELIGDPDTLIAATALVHGLVLVTNNERHFSRVAGLQIDNWSK